jgi:predicted MFS family arabinose efflux permease
MALLLARFGIFERAGRMLLWCVAGFGVTWMLFAVSRSFAISLALLVLGGALDGVGVVLRGTLVQLWTPQEMMGRVAAVNSFFIGSSNELGAFESGLAARLLGVVPSILFGGTMTLVTVAWVTWRSPALRRLRRLAPEVPDDGAHAA